MPVTVTFLGTGTSQGVPMIGCTCRVCRSEMPSDKRLRTSVLLESGDVRIVIDTGPDFRQQMLRENIKSLDAVVFTHEHKDHIAGLDDVRAFNYLLRRPMDIYAAESVQQALKREFFYVFSGASYPGIPRLMLHTISNRPFEIKGMQIIPIPVMHLDLPVLGFRTGGFTYITDANRIPPSSMDLIRGTDVLVLNALRREKHVSHFNLAEALDLVAEISPRMAYFTHISHQLGLHDEVNSELPPNVRLAFDGLKISV